MQVVFHITKQGTTTALGCTFDISLKNGVITATASPDSGFMSGTVGYTIKWPNGDTEEMTAYVTGYPPQRVSHGGAASISSIDSVDFTITWPDVPNPYPDPTVQDGLTVRFYRNDGTQEIEPYLRVDLEQGNALPAVTPPTRAGYFFEGFYSPSGVQVYDKSGTPLYSWYYTSYEAEIAQYNCVLYARWQAYEGKLIHDPESNKVIYSPTTDKFMYYTE